MVNKDYKNQRYIVSGFIQQWPVHNYELTRARLLSYFSHIPDPISTSTLVASFLIHFMMLNKYFIRSSWPILVFFTNKANFSQVFLIPLGKNGL